MCGIAGILGPNSPRHAAALRRMVNTLAHRGPDGQGSCVFDTCILGHTRLSVIDLAGGDQPMVSPDAKRAVVFNGEIYGYRQLRAALSQRYTFRTQSDTEVLLALYDQDGHGMLDELPGMFAFALWDDRRRELFCARDRFGEKPFYYAVAGDGSFVFASELKAIVASGLVNVDADAASIAHYLQYLYVHPAHTIYRNVHVLPPAHRLIWRDGRIDVARYWKLPDPEPGVDVSDAVDTFRARLRHAVARQMVADVPVGAFLSGGLDSSTIVAIAARSHPGCKTFSFGFGAVIDELPYARTIARRYGTEHIEIVDDDSKVAELLPRMASVYDEPFGDSSNIPTFLLCQEARRHVTVALTGEGADELLGGYTFWYRHLFEMSRAADRGALLTFVGRATASLCRRAAIRVPSWATDVVKGFVSWQRFSSLADAHRAQVSCCSESDTAAVVGQVVRQPRPPETAETVDAILRNDLTTYLPGDILVKADRASMAHGLELRAPFLDWEFASFCVALPLSLKITNTTDKAILRRAFANAWTDEVRSRGKQGFGAPVGHWLQRPKVQALKNDALRAPTAAVYDLIDHDAASRWIERNDYSTWALLVLALWAESRQDRSDKYDSGFAIETLSAGHQKNPLRGAESSHR